MQAAYGSARKSKTGSSHVLWAISQVIFTFAGVCMITQRSALVTSGGDIWVTGKNDYGQLGLEGTDSTKSFTKVHLPSDSVIKASCGYYHTLLLTSSGRVYAAGRNDYGQLGLGHSQGRVFGFSEVVALRDRSVVDISAGCYHSCAITYHGMLYMFGRNNHGQLGTGDLDGRLCPHPVDSFLGRHVVKVACGFYHTIVLSTRAEDLNGKVNQTDFQLNAIERSPQQQRDLITFIAGELDRGVRCEGHIMPHNMECMTLLRYQMNAATLLLGLSLEKIVRPVDGSSLMHMFTLEESVELLRKALNAVDVILYRGAKVFDHLKLQSIEDITIEQISSMDSAYSKCIVENVLELYSGDSDIRISFHRLRGYLLQIFNFVYPDADLATDALDVSQNCLVRHADVLFSSAAELTELLTAVSVYVTLSVRDSIMLANGNQLNQKFELILILRREQTRPCMPMYLIIQSNYCSILPAKRSHCID